MAMGYYAVEKRDTAADMCPKLRTDNSTMDFQENRCGKW